MNSEPPSIIPPASSTPPTPGSAAFRSSSAPTTSVAPPAMNPGLLWPCLRLVIGLALLALRGVASFNTGAAASGAAGDAVRALGAALIVAGLPLALPRYRSIRAFSWLFLIVSFLQLYLSKDLLIG